MRKLIYTDGKSHELHIGQQIISKSKHGEHISHFTARLTLDTPPKVISRQDLEKLRPKALLRRLKKSKGLHREMLQKIISSGKIDFSKKEFQGYSEQDIADAKAKRGTTITFTPFRSKELLQGIVSTVITDTRTNLTYFRIKVPVIVEGIETYKIYMSLIKPSKEYRNIK